MDTLAKASNLGRGWILAQLVLVLFTIEGALWTHGRTQAYWSLAGFAVLIVCVMASRPRIKELGIGLQGMWGASMAILLAVLASALMLTTAWVTGTLRGLHGDQPVSSHAVFYAIWAFEQQFILNSFFYRRFQSLLGDSAGAIVITAFLFALVHFPNPVLVPATFIGGLFFVWMFRRWKNIYPLAIAHAILGLTLAITFPDTWIRHMRVGIGYFRFQLG